MSLTNLNLNQSNSIWNKSHFPSTLILALLFLSQCILSEDKGFQFCDNFNDELKCIEPKTENDIVFLDQTKFKKENPTYEDFGNFLYFTARETPGFRLVLDSPWNGKTSEEFRSGYNAYLVYGNAKERMEGNSFQPKTVVSFHYLGALLKEEFRHIGIAKNPFQIEALGPIVLTYIVEIPGKEPISKVRTIQLRWKP
ncbi:hypothetical protein [Leptospira limi]|uniref:Lipoprotein n=1 Tax=Leptospira limi TaxID=2950023 RepID=A0ABT3LY37_9LEPT|nr:hypothetical protein [Leptospira limi]MCW7462621.1 hypothetical protein [Leptospira limi]